MFLNFKIVMEVRGLFSLNYYIRSSAICFLYFFYFIKIFKLGPALNIVWPGKKKKKKLTIKHEGFCRDLIFDLFYDFILSSQLHEIHQLLRNLCNELDSHTKRWLYNQDQLLYISAHKHSESVRGILCHCWCSTIGCLSC